MLNLILRTKTYFITVIKLLVLRRNLKPLVQQRLELLDRLVDADDLLPQGLLVRDLHLDVGGGPHVDGHQGIQASVYRDKLLEPLRPVQSHDCRSRLITPVGSL